MTIIMTRIDTCWIVTRDLHVLSATHRHTSEAAAIEEAERLCRKDGDTFFVFELKGAARSAQPPVEWVPASAPEQAAETDESF
jgi:hypothetical protein